MDNDTVATDIAKPAMTARAILGNIWASPRLLTTVVINSMSTRDRLSRFRVTLAITLRHPNSVDGASSITEV
jgi:hypothetical protein